MTKNIAIFIDGSRMKQFTRGETNVHRLYRMTKDIAGPGQRCHYISGVGTDRVRDEDIDELRLRASIPDESGSLFATAVRSALGAIGGFGLTSKIMEAYAFLVEHYNENANDQVYLFGFSRGAYAARSLAAFIDDVGLLLREHLYLVPDAYEIYRSGNGRAELAQFLTRTLGRAVTLGDAPIPVYLIGAWDTVGSVGVALDAAPDSCKATYHRTLELPPNVTHGRHALALHELREKFPPAPLVKSPQARQQQSLVQAWFAGAHTDVGGGYETSALSDHSLLWMAGEADRLGLAVDYEQVTVAPDPTSAIHQEVNLPHSLFGYACRRTLHDLLEAPDDAAATHWIHPSALRRLAARAAEPAPYPFDAAIAAELECVDRVTRAFALRTATRVAAPPDLTSPGSDRHDRIEAHARRFVPLLHEVGAGHADGVRNLTMELVAAYLEDTEEGVKALGAAFDQCHAELATAAVGGDGPRVPVREWVERTQEGLEAVVDGVREGNVRGYLEKVMLLQRLENGLPVKGVKDKGGKI